MTRYLSLFGLYMTVLLAASLLATSRFRRAEPALRVMGVYLWLNFLTEVLAQYAKVQHQNNLAVYSIGDLVVYLVNLAYFHYSIPAVRKWKAAWYLAGGGIAAGILNMIFFKGIGIEIHNFLFLHGIVTIGLVLFSFARIMMEEKKPDLLRNPHFWIGIVLVSYWCITFCNWTLYDFYSFRDDSYHIAVLVKWVLLVCIVFYGSLGLIIRKLPTRKPAV